MNKVIGTIMTGLAAIAALAGCSGKSEPVVDNVVMNPSVQIKGRECAVESRGQAIGDIVFIRAIDTDGDGHIDEAFKTKGYNLRNFSIDAYFTDKVAKATTHYITPILRHEPERQLLKGFADTRQMSPEYQSSLEIVCIW